MAETSKKNLYFGGVPTDIDLKRLDDAFGVPEIGTIITHEDIENVIMVKWKSHRYATVTTRWRKMLERDHAVLMTAIKGEGYKAANARERVETASNKLGYGKRMIGRAVGIAARTDTRKLSQEVRGVCEHVKNIGQMIRQSISTAPKKIEYPDAEIVDIGEKRRKA